MEAMETSSGSSTSPEPSDIFQEIELRYDQKTRALAKKFQEMRLETNILTLKHTFLLKCSDYDIVPKACQARYEGQRDARKDRICERASLDLLKATIESSLETQASHDRTFKQCRRQLVGTLDPDTFAKLDAVSNELRITHYFQNLNKMELKFEDMRQHKTWQRALLFRRRMSQ